MSKNIRYLKKVKGIDKPIPVRNKPIFGNPEESSSLLRQTDFLLKGVWFNNTGVDMRDNFDPFNDGSLIHTWLNNNIDGTDEIGDLNAAVRGTTFTMIDDEIYGRKAIKSLSGNDCLLVENANFLKNGQPFTISYVGNKDMSISFSYNDAMTGTRWGFGSKGLSAYQCESITLDNSHLNEFNVVTVTYDGLNTSIYINGLLKGTKSEAPYGTHNSIPSFVIGTGVWTYANKPTSSLNTIQGNVRVFNRSLNADEVLIDANKQLMDFTPCNPEISYLNNDGKLLEVEIDNDGNLVDLNYNEFFPQMVMDSAQFKEIQAKEVIVPGMVRRAIQHTSGLNGNSTVTGEWAPFNMFDFEFNTDKYDYIISITNAVSYTNSDAGGGVDINISIDGENIVTSGHLGHTNPRTVSDYLRSHLYTPKLTRGHVGKKKIVCAITPYNSTCTSAGVWDNGGDSSGGRESPTTKAKSDLIIFEIYKGEPNV